MQVEFPVPVAFPAVVPVMVSVPVSRAITLPVPVVIVVGRMPADSDEDTFIPVDECDFRQGSCPEPVSAIRIVVVTAPRVEVDTGAGVVIVVVRAIVAIGDRVGDRLACRQTRQHDQSGKNHGKRAFLMTHYCLLRLNRLFDGNELVLSLIGYRNRTMSSIALKLA
jgi:hypothetical protein